MQCYVACAAAVLAAPLFLSASGLSAQSLFATRVVAFDDRAGAGGGIFQPQNALGAPNGATSVHSLGVGGSLTLGFDVTIVDGPGTDFVVAENPFASTQFGWETFAEVCFVEVSTDGVQFARFPTRYTGPQVEPGAFAFVHAGHYAGFGGVLPVRFGGGDARDPVVAGGNAFDLAALTTHPLVVSGAVLLQQITQVRLVDARSGIDVDSSGRSVRDASTGSADIDAVSVVHYAGGVPANGPSVTLSIDAGGSFTVTIADPDGFMDLDPAKLGFALWGIPVAPADLFSITTPVQVSTTSFTLSFPGPLPPELPLQLTIAVTDFAGHHSSAAETRP